MIVLEPELVEKQTNHAVLAVNQKVLDAVVIMLLNPRKVAALFQKIATRKKSAVVIVLAQAVHVRMHLSHVVLAVNQKILDAAVMMCLNLRKIVLFQKNAIHKKSVVVTVLAQNVHVKMQMKHAALTALKKNLDAAVIILRKIVLHQAIATHQMSVVEIVLAQKVHVEMQMMHAAPAVLQKILDAAVMSL